MITSNEPPGPNDRKVRISRLDGGGEKIYSIPEFQATLDLQEEESDELCKKMKPFERKQDAK